MKRLIILMVMGLLLGTTAMQAQTKRVNDTTEIVLNDTGAVVADSAMAVIDAELAGMDTEDTERGGGLHKQLKRKFLEGSAGFMSLVALALVLGLAFCI